ncbi:MAG: hypothetical protein V3T64_16755, partial [Myxococcota bacterium]
DAMEYATLWPGTAPNSTQTDLGVHFRSARETYTDTLRWMYETGLLQARHVGKLAGEPSTSTSE